MRHAQSLGLAFLSLVLGLTACDQTTPAAVPDAAPSAPAEAPRTATPTDTADAAPRPVTCLEEIGAARSARLVERCIAVSPATRPPCNTTNPCEIIQGEIDRACAMYGPNEARPKECTA